MVGFSLSHTVTAPPIQLVGAEWVNQAYYLSEQIVCNAWMKKGYAQFFDSEDVQVKGGNGGVHIGANDESVYDDADIDSDVDSNLFEARV